MKKIGIAFWMSFALALLGCKKESSDKTIALPGSNEVIRLLKVESGSFVMGSPKSESDAYVAEVKAKYDVDLGGYEEPQHKVKISRDYWLGECEVTQGQWQAVMGSNPSKFQKGNDYPVECVSWEDAMEFCAKLNRICRDEIPSGYQFSLPTQAQWEYACRAGETGPYSGGTVEEVAWYGENSGESTHRVGVKKPNAWGFYDMHGNVFEWCSDWFAQYNGDVKDPVGPETGSIRVFRGGSWHDDASGCRAANRCSRDPAIRCLNLGFRLALVPVQ